MHCTFADLGSNKVSSSSSSSLRRMVDASVPGRDGEEDRKRSGQTRVKEIWKVCG